MTQANPSTNAKQIFDIAMRECQPQFDRLELIELAARTQNDRVAEINAVKAIAEVKIRAISASLVVAAEWAQFEALTKSRLEVRATEEDDTNSPAPPAGAPFDEALPVAAP